MRPDGLSSTALNRGLHLHESRALLFLLSPLFLSPIYFFFQGGSSVASYHEISWGAERKLGRPTEIYGRHSVTAALPLSSSCMLLSQRLSSHKWEGERVEYTKGEIQPHCATLLLSDLNVSLFLQLPCHVFKAWSYASPVYLIMWVWSVWRYLNFIALTVVCFTFNTPGPDCLDPFL